MDKTKDFDRREHWRTMCSHRHGLILIDGGLKRLICLWLFFYSMDVVELAAQSTDFGLWANVAVEKSLKKWSIQADFEFRTRDQFKNMDRWSLKLGAAYDILKAIKLGIGYEYISLNDIQYNDFQPRHRYLVYLQGKQKIGRFTLSLRERIQRTIKDESDRIIEPGEYDNYKINPEWSWRNRFKIAYKIPQIPVIPSISVETFYQLNSPGRNSFSQLRYTLAFDYHLTKRHEIELFGLVNKEIDTDYPLTTCITGLGYKYSF